jgi:di/tricarboxylate transporter
MDFQIILMLITLGAAVLLFTFEWFPVDITALGILLVLILTGLLPAQLAFDGFGSDVFVMMFGLLILTAALYRTGATKLAGQVLLRRIDSTPVAHMTLIVMVVAVITSAFISNTASTALLLPVVAGLAHRMKISPSRVLMPLAFAAISASSLTLIGTSTNIVVSGLMAQSGMAPIGMFELTLAGIPIAMVSLLYMALVGRRLVPDRAPVQPAEAEYSSRFYLSEIRVKKDSTLAGKTLQQTGLGRDLDLTVLQVVREGSHHITPRATTRVEEGDLLVIEGERENILAIKEKAGVDIESDVGFAFTDLEVDEISLHEVIILPGSPLLRRTLKSANVRQQYDLQVLAVNRRGQTLTRKMSEVRLKVGDILLVQASQQQIQALEQQNLFQSLGPITHQQPHRSRALIAIVTFLGAVAAAALNILSLPVAMLLGAGLVLITRCITPEEAYHDIQWTALIVIACMLGLGAAMETTGTAQLLAEKIAVSLGDGQPVWLLSAFFLLTVLLTQPMSNQASAAIVFPVAIQVANRLALNPRSFAMMIVLAASCSFITPLEPASLMVYRPGQYRFLDFLKVGIPLTVLIFIISIVMVPILWPL